VAAAIFVAVSFNFVLNRRFSFSTGRSRSWPIQFAAYFGASSLGAVINYAVTLVLISRDPSMLPQLAAAAGIACATTSNFIASRYLVFRASHIRPSRAIEARRTNRS
jgi:dolichol-phosphate mannosyltransferase